MKNVLHIANLCVSTTSGRKILHGVSLRVKRGEVHAVMGPNGSGKSTLAQALMGSPAYTLTQGKITLDGVDITQMPVDQKAKQGLFLSFQTPVSVSGVNFSSFLRLAVNQNKSNGQKFSPFLFRSQLLEHAKILSFEEGILKRGLNEGFSGGEKKKAEILQLALLQPKYAILDEPDSGLDVDALKYIAKAVSSFQNRLGLILITHYQRIFYYIKPDFVHILMNGRIIQSGDASLAEYIENNGYEQYEKKLKAQSAKIKA